MAPSTCIVSAGVTKDTDATPLEERLTLRLFDSPRNVSSASLGGSEAPLQKKSSAAESIETSPSECADEQSDTQLRPVASADVVLPATRKEQQPFGVKDASGGDRSLGLPAASSELALHMLAKDEPLTSTTGDAAKRRRTSIVFQSTRMERRRRTLQHGFTPSTRANSRLSSISEPKIVVFCKVDSICESEPLSISDRARKRMWLSLWESICNGGDIASESETSMLRLQKWRGSGKSLPETGSTAADEDEERTDEDAERLSFAIRSGVAPCLRGNVWHACSGAVQKKRAVAQSYAALLAAGNSLSKSSENIRVLDADVPRTNVDGVRHDVLRNVLVAFVATESPAGYCQSMSTVAGALLHHLDEERAFWTFYSLLDDVLPPHYYSQNLAGLRADLKVLDSLTKRCLPTLHAHLNEQELDLSPITMTWLLCLFLYTLPEQAAYRVLDCVFHEGPVVLMKVSLAILKMFESDLLQVDSLPAAYAILRSPFSYVRDGQPPNGRSKENLIDELFELMPSLGDFCAEEIRSLRESHLEEVCREDQAAKQRREAFRAGAAVAASEPPAVQLRRRSIQLMEEAETKEEHEAAATPASLWDSMASAVSSMSFAASSLSAATQQQLAAASSWLSKATGEEVAEETCSETLSTCSE
eukprot:TRINITY_DN22175_c0_g1_i1.p1 TRINITY_DN22175_c0_g1~~TRINITY_DN22175_c0_g1_i1.p1  ORF type:complete len:701 (+),score=111.37 TRINITY_DN22175_c0_g1_i1:166-2103(+)